MPRKANNLTGQKFGRLTAVKRVGSAENGTAMWECSCECGAVVSVRSVVLTSGRSKSCGCLMKELASIRMTTHGMSRTPTWYSWDSMIARCTRESHPAFAAYGGRGIKVCNRWRESFEDFLADMGERPEGMTLDRKDGNKGYEPENCRWATATTQSNNRGDFNVTVVRDGKEITVRELAKDEGVSLSHAYRLAHKESAE